MIPYFDESPIYGISIKNIKYLTAFCALLHLLFYLIGFSLSIKKSFKHFNSLIDKSNCGKIALILFVISYLIYVPYGGFRFSIFTQADDVSMLEGATGGAFYALNMISVLTVSCCLFLNRPRHNLFWILFLFLLTIVTYVVGGFRYRLVVLIISAFTFYHLYDLNRKIRWMIIIPTSVVTMFFFIIIGNSRDYGNGLNYNNVAELSINDLVNSEGTGENKSVFEFSTLALDDFQRRDLIFLEPVWCALTMPIPRSVYSSKPNADYLRKAQDRVFGTTSMGAANLNFVEGYMSFGWIRVCLYGLIFGMLSKIYWNNYINNRNSVAAIIMLAVYNGMTYFIISRGYLAGAVTAFVFYMLVPFWMIIVVRFLLKAVGLKWL